MGGGLSPPKKTMNQTSALRFATIFRGLKKCYGVVELTSSREGGKRQGKYRFVVEPRSEETFQKHLDGEISIGIVPINENNRCCWGAIDIDSYPLDHAALVRRIDRLQLPLVACRSKSGGAHIYLFLEKFVEAEVLQGKLREIASELGYASNTEIFPKQTRLVLERGDNGNFLNLPYHQAEGGLRYAFKADGTAATLDEFLAMAERSAISEERLVALLTEESPAVDQRLRDGPPCLQALIRQGFPEGTRNNGLFNLGVYLRKAHPNDWETKILEYNQQIMEPALDLKEVNVVAEQLKRKDYQYKCADIPICNHCNKDLCKSRRHGVGGGANTPSIANLRKYDSEPPLWFLDVNGSPVELDTDGLQRQPRFQMLCMEQINFMPSTISRAAWEAQINALLTQMTQHEGAILESTDDTSIRGQFYDLLEEFTTHMHAAMDREELLLRRPWTDTERGRTYFRLKDFEAFLKRNKFMEYRSNKIAQRLREIGGGPDHFRINGRPIRCWWIPSFEGTKDEFPTRFDDDEVPF